MASTESQYLKLGVDAQKEIVRKMFESVIDNEVKGAFVNMITDPFCEDRYITMHMDGDGSKFIQRLLYYLLTGDDSIFEGMVDDALAMNTGDIAAAGFVFGPWIFTDVLNIGLLSHYKNTRDKIKRLIMFRVAKRISELKELYAQEGFGIVKFLGGETADLPDQINTAVFDVGIFAWADKKDVIRGNVQPEDMICGFASNGQARWEKNPNSGLMSNGYTLARSCLIKPRYNSCFRGLLKRDGMDFYKGRFEPGDKPDILEGMSINDALASPTRQWPIVIKQVIKEVKGRGIQHMLHGIVMNTGGGATKIKNIGKGIIYNQTMPEPPPIFKLIQKESEENWKNMYESFNCGVGITIVGEKNDDFSAALLKVSQECDIELNYLGDCEQNGAFPDRNKMVLTTCEGETFQY